MRFLHKYLRAIGFSKFEDRNKLKDVLTDAIMSSDERAYTMNTENVLLGEFCKNFAHNMGIAVCGEFDEHDKFIYEYYYPYLRGTGITSREDISVERHADKDSYAGVCDDMNVGASLIFYLQNRIPYIKAHATGSLPIKGTTLTLSGLSVQGCVILPIQKDEHKIDKVKRQTIARNKLIEAARKGNEEAIETLTLEDMDIYSNISSISFMKYFLIVSISMGAVTISTPSPYKLLSLLLYKNLSLYNLLLADFTFAEST